MANSKSAAGRGSERAPKNNRLSEPIDPKIVKWARQELNVKVTTAGLREIRQTGGLELDDFIRDLEREALPSE